ncbi:MULTISPECIES: RagB/SusD family nutrient uptake outer membrane protein [Sphingobacterium]|jgi:starch-binding outer membrane protein, SusD/RagB family|uniref:RagB/SusD family nutrient uptake outer membrane protein n=1 Tax=Sphingobacterium TaxID=28453 RepID=UPI00095A2441|nr:MULTISPECIES: RagB/SusD family nutrient uptake outer membrane protein [Sphingobacterium]OJZ01393.1 MAG: hypothetical protein BGP15_18530 [Sphingobacterium sp. 40-24]HAF36501.1 hypothetical protein [Sphingobacterium sp.]
MQIKRLMMGVILGMACYLSACKDFLGVELPKNELVTETVFSDSINASQAVLGIYIAMVNETGLSFGGGALTVYPGLSADEIRLSAEGGEANEFEINSISPFNSINYALWSRAYEYIYKANACIEGISNSTGIGNSAKNNLIAEVKFLRAFIYFNLINIFGDVPLVLGVDYTINRIMGATVKENVYKQIEEDLLFSQQVLRNLSFKFERANYFAVAALLARVYLFQKKYSLAKNEADKVINSGKFSLEKDLEKVFLLDSKEIIWALLPVLSDRETAEGYFFVPSSDAVAPTYLIRQELYNSFEDGDLRKVLWVGEQKIGGNEVQYPQKYRNRRPGGSAKEIYSVLRLAELYLIRAEANLFIGDLKSASDDLNMVRTRSGLTKNTVLDESKIFDTLVQERRKELFCEWGNRWLDLKRWDMTVEVIGDIKGGWEEKNKVYPIPQKELSANPFLEQNTGYEDL